MVVDSSGNLFVADRAAGVIFKVTPTATVSTFAGGFGIYGHTDGVGTNARFFKPYQLAIDEQAICMSFTWVLLRKITPLGVVSTIALKWGTPSLHAITVTNGMVYGVTSRSDMQGQTSAVAWRLWCQSLRIVKPSELAMSCGRSHWGTRANCAVEGGRA